MKRDWLTGLLAHLRALHWCYWTAHWQAKGDPAYGDHLLYQRLYEGMVDEIDGLAEKCVAYFGEKAVCPNAQIVTAAHLVQQIHENGDLATGLQMSEEVLQRVIRELRDRLSEGGELSVGLEDYLGGLANAHETNQYLLGQRLQQDQSVQHLVETWDDLAYRRQP